MSDTYNYEVLEPGGHARLVGNVLDRISEASANPASAVGSSRAVLGDAETASWMERTTAADGAALIESICGNTVVDSGSLLPVRMEGVETVGFNLAKSTYVNSDSGNYARTLFAEIDWMKPSTQYAITFKGAAGNKVYLSENLFTAGTNFTCTGELQTVLATTVSEVSKDNSSQYVTGRGWSILKNQGSNTVVPSFTEVCINLSDPSRNGTYEPHWSSQRTIMAATYFPDGMRGVGTGDNMVCDELTNHEAIHRVGSTTIAIGEGVTFFASSEPNSAGLYNHTLQYTESAWTASGLNTATYNASHWLLSAVSALGISDATGVSGATTAGFQALDNSRRVYFRWPSLLTQAQFETLVSSGGGVMFFALATPTTTPIDPPLPMSYRVGAGSTERVMVAEDTMSAPPIFVTRYPLDPADLAASIAPRESATAEANHAVGDLVMLGFTLCKVTTAIARGEAIAIGTNVTQTSVAAEIAALS